MTDHTPEIIIKLPLKFDIPTYFSNHTFVKQVDGVVYIDFHLLDFSTSERLIENAKLEEKAAVDIEVHPVARIALSVPAANNIYQTLQTILGQFNQPSQENPERSSSSN